MTIPKQLRAVIRQRAAQGAIAWQWWSGKTDLARPGRWSKQHRTHDGERTLCGLIIPRDVADVGGEYDGDGICLRCRKSDQPCPSYE